MIIVMKPEATKAQIEHLIERVRTLKLEPRVIVGTERTVIAVVGDERPAGVEVFETGPGVERVVPILAPYKMASTEAHHEPTLVPLGNSRWAASGSALSPVPARSRAATR